MSLAIDIAPAIGEIVRVRSRRYLVEEVSAPPTPGDDTLVRLTCLEIDAEGEELQVLTTIVMLLLCRSVPRMRSAFLTPLLHATPDSVSKAFSTFRPRAASTIS